MSRTGAPARCSLGDLPLDRLRHRDQLVHVGCQAAQRLAVLGRPDSRRVDRRDDIRPLMAGVAERDRRLRPDDVGPIHVGVDDVGSDASEVGGEGRDRGGVVGLVDDA